MYVNYQEKYYKLHRKNHKCPRVYWKRVTAGDRWHVQIKIIGGRLNKGSIYRDGKVWEISRDGERATESY